MSVRFLAALCLFVCTHLYAGNSAGSTLKVSLTPTQAVSSGAQWNVDGGAWRDSGNSVTGLSAGSHTVSYKPIAGWIAPAPTTVTLKNGANTLSATYVNAATLKITLTPTSGQWRVDGGSWQASGATLGGLTPGNHTVSYATLSGYTSPANETISLTAGQAATLTRSYVQLGQLKITLTPTSGQWRVDGGAWQPSGSTVPNLISGSHVVDYSLLTGYSAPAAESITLAVGQSLTLARSYTQLAQISITLVPGSGQWRANGGAWQSSGASLLVLPGNYTVEYSALSLYDSPPNDVFALSPGGVFANTRYYVSQKPTLTVALTPNTGQWRVDGGAWQISGATVTELDVGSHTLDYFDIGGSYAQLSSETISLNLRDHVSLSRAYALKPASLSVTLVPNAAQWRVDGGAWQSSGAVVSSLVAGSHTVEYNGLSGYTSPASETVNLAAGQFLSLSRSYIALPAQLSLTLTPATGQWRIDGGAWQTSGTTVTGLNVGSHTVEYNSLSGYSPPATESITLSAGQSLSLSRSYTVVPTQLTVTLTPNTAQWRVDGGAWKASAATVTDLATGTHTINYNSLSGYTAPATETITLAVGQSLSLSRTYTALPGQLTITFPQLAGQFRVDGGNFYTSGMTVSGLAVGSHLVEYSSLTGYAPPPSESININPGEALSLSRSYTVLNPAQLTVTLTPTSGQWRVDNSVWLASGATVGGLRPGVPHSIEYSTLSGYITPSGGGEMITPGPNEVLSLARSYTARPTQLTITLAPGTGQWRLDGGEWQTSGATATGLTAGTHAVDYKDIPYHIAPTSESVFVAFGQSVTLTRAYTPQPVAAYVATDLGTLNGASIYAKALNNAGTVVGFALQTDGKYRAIRYESGALQDLGTLGGLESYAFGINQKGEVAGEGYTTPAGSDHRAFKLSGGIMQNLGALGGVGASRGYAINQTGIVVGYTSTSSNYEIHAFKYEGDSMQDLGTLGGNDSRAFAINTAGNIVGVARLAGGNDHAFRYSNGIMEDLGTLGGTSSQAKGINDAGAIVGSSVMVDGTKTRAFIYTPADHVMHDLGALGSAYSGANAINEAGRVVGSSNVDDGVNLRHAFIHDGLIMTDLNVLVTIPGAELTDATGINDLGQIAAVASNGHSYLLTPVGAPGGIRIELNNASGQWRIDGNAWQTSGATVLNLSAGSHLVEYSGIHGYNAPAAETVTIESGRLLQLNRTYTALPLASVMTYVSPAGVSAQWRLDGGAWQLSGVTLNNVSYDVSHTVEFATVAGYVTPSSQTFTLASGELRTLFATYSPLASVTAYFSPSDISAQWRLDGGAWQLPGATLNNVAYDVSHVVEFSSVPGYGTPPAQTVTVTSGQVTTVFTSYEPLTGVAQLSVSLSPIRGQWRIDGGEWRDHGAYVTNLSLGVHTIEYLALPNYVSPPTETVMLTDGHSTFLDRVYQLVSTVQYSVTDLGNLGGTSNNIAAAVNLSGMVVGTSHLASGPARAFLYRDGAMQSLGTLGSDLYSFGNGLNDDGDVVGVSFSTADASRPFVYRNGVMQDLGSLGGANGASYDVTNTGFAVGHSQASPTRRYAFIHDGVAMVSLGSLGGSDSVAYSINEGGTVVGSARVLNYHAFRWRNGMMEDLSALLNTDTSFAYDVNEAGTIVGARLVPGGDYRAFSLTDGGVVQDLGRLGATYSYARAINGAGHVVGNSSTESGNHAFINRGVGIEDLNDLVNLPGVVLEFADDINDLGQIAANGSNEHVYLLTPINGPGGLRVDLTPAAAQWRVDGGAWQTSGSPVLNLTNGTHTIEYSEAAGYTRPLTETVTVSSGRLLQLKRSYTSM